MAMKDINLYLGSMDRRDYPKVEQIVSDVFGLVDFSGNLEDIRKVEEKIQFAIYIKLDELVSVDIRPDADTMGYEISINYQDPKHFSYNTYGNY